MKITIQDRRGRPLLSVDVDPSSTVDDLKSALHRQYPRYPPERQRLTIGQEKGSVALLTGKQLSEYTQLSTLNSESNVIQLKDLGPQIGWKTVFLIEYAGPLLLYPLIYFITPFYYDDDLPAHWIQRLACMCWAAHYIKRELETLFVHVFSKGTMPLMNVFKNSIYYWGAALAISFAINRPAYVAPSNEFVFIGLALFVIGEIGNLACHLILANLRNDGSKERKIPRGFLFELVTSPNYTCEILAWFGFSVMTMSIAAFLFTIIGGAQMTVWATQKHRANKKQFHGRDGVPLYPTNRKVLFPFIY